MTNRELTPEEPRTSGFDRRTVLRTSAWAVPVVMAATAVPAQAASTARMANVSVSIFPEVVTIPLAASEPEWAATRLSENLTISIEPNPGAGVPVSVGIYGNDGSAPVIAWAEAGSEYRELHTDAAGQIVVAAGDVVSSSTLAEINAWADANGTLPSTSVHLLIEGQLYAIQVQLSA